MRQTICAFLFDHLDAQEVTSAAFLDNPASLAVSRKVGYRSNGRTRDNDVKGSWRSASDSPFVQRTWCDPGMTSRWRALRAYAS